MLNINKIYNEDCLEGMKKIDDNMIDLCKKIYKKSIFPSVLKNHVLQRIQRQING